MILSKIKEDNGKTLVSSILFFVFTFFIFGPLSLYLTNTDEFWFGMTDILWCCIVCAIVIMVVLVGVGLLFRQSGQEWYICGVFGITLGLYIQGNYITTDYGTLDGTILDWSQYKSVEVWNSLLWIGCVLLPFVVRKCGINVWKSIIRYVSLGVIGVQLFTITVLGVNNIMQTNADDKENFSLTNNAKFELSYGENTVIFILDCYDAQYFDEFIEKYPVYKDSLFKEFLYYPDTVGGATRTVLAVPYILTGQAYTSENGYINYLKESYANTNLYKELKRKNYTIGIYANSTYISPEMDEVLVNYGDEEKKVASYSKLTYYLYKLTACRYFPHVLKESVWMYTGDFENAADQSGSAVSTYIVDDAAFYQSLIEDGITAQSDANAFRVYHLMGAHSPYTLTAQSQRDKQGTSLEEQQLGIMNILMTYFEQMKKLGIYDNANIIVMADHGGKGHEQNPLLLIKKGSYTNEFLISDMPVSYANLHPTLNTLIGSNAEGTDIFSLKAGDNPRRLFYKHSGSEVVEYEICGVASDKKNVVETGNRYSMLDVGVSHEYKLGTEVYFDVRATGTPYVVSGFRRLETTHTWTLGNESVLRIPLEEKPHKDLFVSFSYAIQMRSCQRVGVYVNDELLGWYKVSEKMLKFKIPAEMITSDELELKFELPDAAAPADLSKTATDTTILSLAFYSMIIREAEDMDTETPIVEWLTTSVIDFGKNGNNTGYLGYGWYGQEESARWASGAAQVVFRADWTVPQTLRMTFRSYQFSGDTEIYCNNHYIGTIRNNSSVHTETFVIPEVCLSTNGTQSITFVTAGVTSPKANGNSGDGRNLGLFVSSMEIISETVE